MKQTRYYNSCSSRLYYVVTIFFTIGFTLRHIKLLLHLQSMMRYFFLGFFIQDGYCAMQFDLKPGIIEMYYAGVLLDMPNKNNYRTIHERLFKYLCSSRKFSLNHDTTRKAKRQ